MFKFVLFCFVATVVMGSPVYFNSPLLSHLVPAAISHSSRVDYPKTSLYAAYVPVSHGYSHAYDDHYSVPVALGHAPLSYSAYSSSIVGHPPPNGNYYGYNDYHY